MDALSASNIGAGNHDGRRSSRRSDLGVATSTFTQTMGIAGRSFSATDSRTSTPVVVVNETLARKMWPGRPALGEHLDLQGVREVVGVIHDGKYRRLDEEPTAYTLIPFAQRYSERMTIYARVRDGSADGIGAVREEVARLDRNIALERAGRLEAQLDVYTMPQRVAAWSVGLFGLFGRDGHASGRLARPVRHQPRRSGAPCSASKREASRSHSRFHERAARAPLRRRPSSASRRRSAR
jgi:hypothetical protein